MQELEQLLDEAGATAELREQARAIFGSDSMGHVRPVALEPTIRQSLDLRNQTVLRDEATSGAPLLPRADETSHARIGRYIDLGLLGRGGMGEVRRVLDPELHRRLAMKIIHPELLSTEAHPGRFVEEAQVVAQLQHPNIVPIHELGVLDDGRLYFTMKEVQGRPLSDLIAAVHAASSDHGWQATEDGWTFRRLMQVFARVCAATAFAHSRGVVHRDLKPENILVGRFDEVLVVDWGIAKIVEHLRQAGASLQPDVRSSRTAAHMTRMGEVAGTPAYMPPEQARGQLDQIDARSDIYALGAILYEILSGRCPYGGSSSEQVLSKVILGPPPSVRTTILSQERTTGTIELDFFSAMDELEALAPDLEGHNDQGIQLPDDLVMACEKAMQRKPDARHSKASELQQVILDWIDGANKRDRALAIVSEAGELTEVLDDRSARRAALQARAAAAREGHPAWATADDLAAVWALEAEATSLEQELLQVAVQREQLLQSALTHVADLPEAHAALLALYTQRHVEAEASGDRKQMAAARLSMELHCGELPAEHADRKAAEAHLLGRGRLSLRTERPGAAVYCARFAQVDRRLVLGEERLLGHTPLEAHPMDMGSYSLRICQQGCHDVVYPVRIDRQGHWSGHTPDGDQPAVWLPPEGSVSEDECFVAAGPFLCGRDAGVPEGLRAAEIWVDDFIIQRFQVTYAQYQAYLQALLDAGREADFEAACPVSDAAASGSSGKSCFLRGEAGRVVRVEDPTGVVPEAQWPVAFVSFRQAVGYVDWCSERTGQRWRVLHEFEWEKAARGVDARIHPWGDAFSPSWCNMDLSREHKGPIDVDSCPVDCSVYGVRGMAGNIAEWTSSAWTPDLQEGGFQRVPPQISMEKQGGLRTFRGGCWMLPAVFSRTSNRIGFHETDGVMHVGFRVGRSVDR